jgi:hypothetical protein
MVPAAALVRLARGVGLTAFYRQSSLARRFASQVHGMGADYGGVHGRVRQQHDWAGGGMVGATRPQRARHVGNGDGAWMAVRRKGGVHGARTKAGLGVQAQRATARPTRDVGAAVTLWSARSQNQISLTRFDRIFSKKLNCSGPRGNKESCRSLDPPQFLERVYGLFLNQLCTNHMPRWLFSGHL